MDLINKATNLVGMVIGITQVSLPIIKEAIAVVTRICGTIFFWTDVDEKILVKVNAIYNKINEGFEKFKNLWLSIGRK